MHVGGAAHGLEGHVKVLVGGESLAQLLSSGTALASAYGDVVARRITQRLQELVAADSLDDMRMLPGRTRELSRDRPGQLAVDLDGHHLMVFRPNPDPIPTNTDGSLAWAAVTEVVVIEIVEWQ